MQMFAFTKLTQDPFQLLYCGVCDNFTTSKQCWKTQWQTATMRSAFAQSQHKRKIPSCYTIWILNISVCAFCWLYITCVCLYCIAWKFRRADLIQDPFCFVCYLRCSVWQHAFNHSQFQFFIRIRIRFRCSCMCVCVCACARLLFPSKWWNVNTVRAFLVSRTF